MAAFFWIHAGANNNVGTVNNWSATSGGGTNGATPSITSDVTYDGAGANGNDASTVAASVSFLSLTFTSGYTNTVTINTTVILTVAGNFTDRTEHSWVVSGTGILRISATSTIISNGKTFPGGVSFTGASTTKTISGDWTITGTLDCGSTNTINKTTAEIISCAGLTVSATISGTINITLTGGTWSGSSTNTMSGTISLAGNVIISGSVNLSGTGETLQYTSGTITTTGSTLTVNNSCTLDTNGISFNNVTFTSNAQTVTINSLLTISATLSFGSNVNYTFAGTAGFTCATLSATQTVASTITLVNTVTYTITTAFNAFNSRTGSILLFTSDHASNKAILTLNNGATCNVLASFTRIDASNGRAIWTFNGVVTTCNNIFSLTDLSFIKNKINATQAVGTY